MGGVFITIEGVEGSGKSTQILRLDARLRSLGLPAVFSKEPGGTPLGRELRSLLLSPHASGEAWCPQSELLLFYADRAQHIATLIRPALAEGKVVVVDRFEDSTRAYQGASGVEDGVLMRMRDLVLGGFRPHLTIILDMDPEDSIQRVEARNASLGSGFNETRFDSAALSFHRKVRERFLEIAHQEPARVKLVPADDSPEQVATGIWFHVSHALKQAGFQVP